MLRHVFSRSSGAQKPGVPMHLISATGGRTVNVLVGEEGRWGTCVNDESLMLPRQRDGRSVRFAEADKRLDSALEASI